MERIFSRRVIIIVLSQTSLINISNIEFTLSSMALVKMLSISVLEVPVIDKRVGNVIIWTNLSDVISFQNALTDYFEVMVISRHKDKYIA